MAGENLVPEINVLQKAELNGITKGRNMLFQTIETDGIL